MTIAHPRRLAALVTAAALGLVTVAAPAASAVTTYDTMHPYNSPSGADIAAYSEAPSGYHPIYTESVNRHGSRGLSAYKYDAVLTIMARTAAAENGFVSEAAQTAFLANLQGITDTNVIQGYGALTQQGADDLAAIGRRAYERNQELFTAAAANGDTVAWQTSGKNRATESGVSFQEGFAQAGAGSLAGSESDFAKRPDLLYFHKVSNPDGTSKEEGTPEYDRANAYSKYNKAANAAGGVTALAWDYVHTYPAMEQAADNLLGQIFTADFIARIGQDAGHIWYNTVDGAKGSDPACTSGPGTAKPVCGDAAINITTKVDAAEFLYMLYATQADMPDENKAPHAFDFTPYFAGKDADRLMMEWLLDTADFYSKGPGVEGHDETYKVAEGLLEDFFAGIDARAAGGKVAATYRFGHFETTMPFAALLKLPGFDQQAPALTAAPTSIHDVFNYGDFTYRSDEIGAMAMNIQWDVVGRDGTDPATGQAYTPLVRMLFNEIEIPFNATCTPVAAGSHWYKATELKRCLMGTTTTEDPTIPVTTPSPSPSASPSASAAPSPTATPATSVTPSATASAKPGIPTGNTGTPVQSHSGLIGLLAVAALAAAAAVVVRRRVNV
ncbi:MAG: histidine phosphatase family protein [Propionibacteriaceae bacterium]|jgi:hypothetical protein|nr:histidine phosphatase family protein [Propionibacteriaceae bacterium]